MKIFLKKAGAFCQSVCLAVCVWGYASCSNSSGSQIPFLTPVLTYNVDIGIFENGSVSASKTSGIKAGETVTLTISPANCYELETISASTSSENVALSGSGGARTFTMPAANVSVTAEFDLAAPAGFVKVKGGTYDGSDWLAPFSDLFVKGRKVNVEGFFMCEHEVTQSEYETYCIYGAAAPDDFYGVGPNLPVYHVTWYDAVVYCNLRTIAEFGEDECVYSWNGDKNPRHWADRQVGTGDYEGKYCGPFYTSGVFPWEEWGGIKFDFSKKGYRLPTEIEWEYAARNRNADSFVYAGSNDVSLVAWYRENSGNKVHDVKSDKQSGKNSANGLGLYDMGGNVAEWCHDWWGSLIDADTPVTGPTSGKWRVTRGGSWWETASGCSVDSRTSYIPAMGVPHIGFRVVRALKPAN